ncbi:MAG: DUF4375 domain-containing protein [Pirellulales bacterium]
MQAPPDDDQGGFLEIVKDPDSLPKVRDEFARRDARVGELAKLAPQELVEMIVAGKEANLAESALRHVGSGAGPVLLNSLQQDKRLRAKDSEALERVLSCLEQSSKTVPVELLAPLGTDPRKPVRKKIAVLLGSTGRREAVEPLTALLRDEDEYVRSFAMIGINRAVEENRATPEFRSGLFEPVAALCFGTADVLHHPSRCLLGLERERAIAYLTQPHRLKARQPGLYEVLQSLEETESPVDEQLLLAVWNELEADASKYPNDYVLEATLPLLAAHDTAAARAVIERGARSSAQQVRIGAARARAKLAGLDDPFRSAWAPPEGKDWSDFTEPQRHVSAVQILDAEVRNGGFLQYFFNSSGDQWPAAAAGLTAIGAKRDRELVDRAIALFGPTPPSTDREERARQLAALAEKDEEAFGKLEEAYYKDPDDLEVLLLDYVIKPADDFRQPTK